jgi:hypothetical protein
MTGIYQLKPHLTIQDCMHQSQWAGLYLHGATSSALLVCLGVFLTEGDHAHHTDFQRQKGSDTRLPERLFLVASNCALLLAEVS